MTLGAVTTIYLKRTHETQESWKLFLDIVKLSSCDDKDFIAIIERMIQEKVVDHRNALAHGGAISEDIATKLRDSIIGKRNQPGILCWMPNIWTEKVNQEIIEAERKDGEEVRYMEEVKKQQN